jgi:hypothetical protein
MSGPQAWSAYYSSGTALNLLLSVLLVRNSTKFAPFGCRKSLKQLYFRLPGEPLPVFCVATVRLPTRIDSKRGGSAMWLTLFAVVTALAVGFALGALVLENAEEKAPS